MAHLSRHNAPKGLLGYANTARDVRNMLRGNNVLINKVVRKDYRFPVGLFDVIELPKTKEYFRLIQMNNLRFILYKISREEAEIKPSKIIKKTKLKKGKLQINLSDGRNLLVGKDDYKVGDTLMLDLNTNTAKSHLKLHKNSHVYLMEGKYTGRTAVIDSVIETKNLNPAKIICKSGEEKFETLKKYAFVIGDEITIPK